MEAMVSLWAREEGERYGFSSAAVFLSTKRCFLEWGTEWFFVAYLIGMRWVCSVAWGGATQRKMKVANSPILY